MVGDETYNGPICFTFFCELFISFAQFSIRFVFITDLKQFLRILDSNPVIHRQRIWKDC